MFLKLNIIFKKIIIFSFFFILIYSNLYPKNTIGIFCKNIKLENSLKTTLKKSFYVSSLPNNSSLLICGSKIFIKKCLKYNKKIIAINIISYEANSIKNSNIIAYFPINFKINDVYNFIKYKINLGNKCLITHYNLNKFHYKDLLIFKVKKIGEVPYILDKALAKCDLIIGIPDPVVFNYFSTRFIIKKIILNGKIFTGFSKEMTDLGAIYSFDLNLKKYVKKITDFIIFYFKNKNKIKKQKIFYPNFSEFDIFENKTLLNLIKNEAKK